MPSDMENTDYIKTSNSYPPPTTKRLVTRACPSARAHPGIKGLCTPTVTLIYPPPFLIPLLTPRPLDLPLIPLIYLCYLRALFLTLSCFITHHTMVSTRTKNQFQHPAAPVMTKAAKEKASIIKKRPKKATKDDTIQELQARLAALEDPNGEPFSKEPLVHVPCPFLPNTVFMSGLGPGLTLAQGFLEDQKGEEDELDEEEGIGGCWGDRGVDEFV